MCLLNNEMLQLCTFFELQKCLVINPAALAYLKHSIKEVPVSDFCVHGLEGGEGGGAPLGARHHQGGVARPPRLGGHRAPRSTDPSWQSKDGELVNNLI